MTYLKCSIWFSNQKIGLSYNISVALDNTPSIVRMLSSYSLMDISKVITSSRYTNITFHLTVENIMSVALSNVFVAVFRPYGLLKSLKSPWCNVKVISLVLVITLDSPVSRLSALLVEYAHFA